MLTHQFELSPPILHQKGLTAALGWLATSTQERSGIAMCSDIPAPGCDGSLILFQCARELMYNLIKHSGATRSAIRVHVADRELVIAIQDNGCGWTHEAPQNLPAIRATGSITCASAGSSLAAHWR